MKRCNEEFTDDYVAAVRALIAGNRISAADILRKIPGSITFFPKRANAPSFYAQVSVFRRDGFHCRYCGRRTIFLPLLRALSRLFPEELPWHPHAKLTNCHLAFWRDIASCDHLVPLARGGSSFQENLVTACYMCNSIKQSWLLTEMRWDLLPEQRGNWDGLTGEYSALVSLLGNKDTVYHRRWQSALAIVPQVAKGASASQ